MNCSHIENTTDGLRGTIEVVCGSMFSGKTEELMRRLRRATIAGQQVATFKPQIDTRYDNNNVVSHDRNSLHSMPIPDSSHILELLGDARVVGIDEAQFFDPGLVDVVQGLADRGVRVIIAGLDMDFRRQPFGPMPQLCAIADSVDKIHAICLECGRLANYSYRLSEGDQQVMLGETKEYSPLCRACYLKHQAH